MWKEIASNLIWFVVIVVIVSVIAGCKTKNASNNDGYHKISAQDAKSMMDEGNPYTILDVRTEGEYESEHINGAILIPYNEIKNRAESELADKSALIFVYCQTGVRAAAACKTLVSLGYTNVYDMGGIVDWPYDTVVSDRLEY